MIIKKGHGFHGLNTDIYMLFIMLHNIQVFIRVLIKISGGKTIYFIGDFVD